MINVLRLADYRDRRRQRLRLAEAIHGADPLRSALVGHLAEMASLVGADRVATVWVDEYGAGLVHPHAVVDLLRDRPRRAFAQEPLRRAWESGVPGVYETRTPHDGATIGDLPQWTMAVALGSDGTRAWFLTADSVSPRGTLPAAVRDRVMFLAGECSAVVLHRDLDAAAPAPGGAARGARFAGWPVLADLEGREEDEELGGRVSLRFMVARLPRLLADDDFAIAAERAKEQAEHARREIDAAGAAARFPGEYALWTAVLDAYERRDLGALGCAVQELAAAVDRQDHLLGAADLYRTAYEILASQGVVDEAITAARGAGRALRRAGRWAQANAWYDVARGVAEAADDHGSVALTLDGLAAGLRERGNLPLARATLEEGLERAMRSGDPEVVGRLFHGFMGLEQASRHYAEAMRYGWEAVQRYRADGDKSRVLVGLGALFLEAGHWSSAEDAFLTALKLTGEHYYRIYATDALGHVAALRGDAALFARRAAEADALDWEAGPAHAKVEILLHRGVSYAALGQEEEARRWLTRALRYAEAHGFGKAVFAAEEELARLDGESRWAEGNENIPEDAGADAPRDVVDGLRRMREALVGAGA